MLDLMEQTPFKFISEQTRKRCNLKSQKIGVWGDYGVENHNGKLYQLISITERPHRDRKYDIGFNMTSWVIGTKAFTYSLILKGHTLKKSELKIKINKNLSVNKGIQKRKEKKKLLCHYLASASDEKYWFPLHRSEFNYLCDPDNLII